MCVIINNHKFKGCNLMKIGIVGNYGNNNNGDESILYSILQQLKQEFNVSDKDITVFSNNPVQTSSRYGVKSYPLYYKRGMLYKTFYYTYKFNKQYVATFDLLIIGGGGILMDFYKREAHLYSTYALMAKNTGVPYIIYGCGAGPLDTFMGKFGIRFMCKYAANISVRDPQSKALLQRIGVKRDIEVIGDPAFTLRRERSSYADRPIKIGVSAVPYFNANYWPEGDDLKYDAYISGMAANLDALAEQLPVEITFFATKYPHDVTVTKDIQKKMKNRDQTMILNENLLPERLLDVTASQDIIIGTRLHSLILATDTETPIIAISYHTKVKDFMALIGATDRCILMGDLEKESSLLVKAVQRLQDDWSQIISQTKVISLTIHNEAMKGKQLMRKAVNRL